MSQGWSSATAMANSRIQLRIFIDYASIAPGVWLNNTDASPWTIGWWLLFARAYLLAQAMRSGSTDCWR